MLTLRLDEDVEEQIEKASKESGITKSELIRRSVASYLVSRRAESPWALGQALFGKYRGPADLSLKAEGILKAKFKKH